MDLVEFLRAMLDRDEQIAQASERAESASLAEYAADRRVTVTEASLTNHWDIDRDEQQGGWSITAGTYTEVRDGRTRAEPWTVAGPGYSGGGVRRRETAEHIARHDPARILADVEADRKLIAEYEQAAEFYSRPENRHHSAGELHGLYTAVKIRAERFVDHPGYKSEWKP